MFLTWDEPRVCRLVQDCPKYLMMGLRDLLATPEKYLDQNTHARIKLDVPI